jgi:hypothetical protein
MTRVSSLHQVFRMCIFEIPFLVDAWMKRFANTSLVYVLPLVDIPETVTEAMTSAPEKSETVASTEANAEGSPVSFTWTTEPTTVPTFIEISTISSMQNASTPFFPSSSGSDGVNTTMSGATEQPVDGTTLMNMPSLEGINYKLSKRRQTFMLLRDLFLFSFFFLC